MAHVKATVRFGAVPGEPALSEIDWLLPRITRIFVLAAWVADPTMLHDPDRADREISARGVPRLLTARSAAFRPDSEPRLISVKPESFQMAYRLPPAMLWALCQMLEEVDATPGVITVGIADSVLWPLRELPRSPDRVAAVLPELRRRLEQIEAHFE